MFLITFVFLIRQYWRPSMRACRAHDASLAAVRAGVGRVLDGRCEALGYFVAEKIRRVKARPAMKAIGATCSGR